MATPSFNGSTIFGIAQYSRAVPNPHRIQWNLYNGVNGRERIVLGSSGGRVEFPAFLQFATDPLTLGAYETIFITLLANATPGVLVDTLGQSWLRATLTEFEPISEVEADANGVYRTYRAVFEIP